MPDQRDPQTYAIIGAAMAVHCELGPGFLENVYHEALAVELSQRHIPYSHEVEIAIRYRGNPLRCKYKADFICFDRVILEIKAVNQFVDAHEAQLINYLKATGYTLGLLLNFGAPSLAHRRMVYNHAD